MFVHVDIEILPTLSVYMLVYVDRDIAYIIGVYVCLRRYRDIADAYKCVDGRQMRRRAADASAGDG